MGDECAREFDALPVVCIDNVLFVDRKYHQQQQQQQELEISRRKK